MMRLCKFSGKFSYPLYITHIPFLYVPANFAQTRHPGKTVVLTWIFLILTLTLAVAVAWLALKYVDEPVRAWLTVVTASSGQRHSHGSRAGRDEDEVSIGENRRVSHLPSRVCLKGGNFMCASRSGNDRVNMSV
jgi:hypothetical protein